MLQNQTKTSIKLGYLLLPLFLITLSFHAKSQEIYKRKAVYGELLGSAVFASVNYDFRFKPGNDGYGMRVGISGAPSLIIMPVEINDLIGEKRFAFEYGLGLTFAYFTGPVSQDLTFSDNSQKFGAIAFAKAGLRFTPKENGLFFNLNWTPLFNIEGATLGWFGMGIGYSWKHGVK